MEGPCLWHIPMFRFPGVKYHGTIFFWHVLFVFWRGGGGGVVGYKVATLGMMLLAMVLVLARVARPGQY